ncbi:branched-chain amino acid ABC transporter ATP-binding protein/permease [Acidocella facilis]|uniref:branched-chain amino acid ABC transporter ATP-binding protein/permease n=1 Tax=Acidocella facilis TaxID=525 RepID=UPI001F174BC9|nr:branched-chain amino acid ABC transporter ATP-binding protein/permease [Acidocella facilis]
MKHPVLILSAVLVVLGIAAPSLGMPLSKLTEIVIYVLYGLGVNMLVGYTGLVPFGASVFFGCSTYFVAIFMLRTGGNEVVALGVAVLGSLLLALLLGLLILRRRGLYFSLLTLAASQIAFEVAFKWTALTGGENGLQGVSLSMLTTPLRLYMFTAGVAVAVAWGLWRLAHAPFGRALQALRDNEQRMSCLGYNTAHLKLAAFCLCGAVVGLAGGLLALLLQGAYADNLGWEHAGDALLMTVLGGVHQFLGPLWGAIAFVTLQDRLSLFTANWWLIFAPIIMGFALASPEGIQGLAQRLLGRQSWTLTRNDIPNRPDVIAPYQPRVKQMDLSQPVLTVRNLTNRFGSLYTARNIDLDVMPCQLHSFIGPNGAGKTTFFNLLTGLLQPTEGRISLAGRDITRLKPYQRVRLGLSRSFQIVSVFKNLTAFENVRIAVQRRHTPRFAQLLVDAYRMDQVNARTWTLLAAVGLEQRAAEQCVNLSHGEQRLLEIAISLATDANLLLLDEPLAGLAQADRQVVGALIRRLAEAHAVLLIEHDMDRVLTLSDRITVLHQGALIADGKPADVAANPAVISAYLGAEREAAQEVHAPEPSAPGKLVLEVKALTAGYAGSVVIDKVSFTLREGEALAILGRNGVGKTTTLKSLMGAVEISGGEVLLDGQAITGRKPFEINRRGISLVPEGRRLFPNLTVLENLRLATRPGGATLDEVYALFPKLQILAKSRASSLSGGERQMVAVARALMVPSRVILLDEPFEGLAPAVVKEVMEAVVKLRRKASLIIVEHHAESVLSIVDRAVVLVNGEVAYDGTAQALAADEALQAKLLGVVNPEAA